MISDGSDYQHKTHYQGRSIKQSHYDKIWHRVQDTNVSMMGDHSVFGGVFTLVDPNDITVGEVSFSTKGEFLAGKIYGTIFVAGRLHNKTEAFYAFYNELDDIHARP